MPVLEKQKPLYRHDCKDCIYLGSDEIRDYYFCIEHSAYDSGTLIIRLGNYPSDYFSMPVKVLIDALKTNFIERKTYFIIVINVIWNMLGKVKRYKI